MTFGGVRVQSRARSVTIMRRRSILIFVIPVVLTVVASGCYVNQNGLWAADRLSPDAPTQLAPTRAMVAYGPLPDQHLNLHLPDRTRFAHPVGVIMWLHSGGWCCGDQIHTDPLILDMVSQGYAVVAIDYRRTPQFHLPAIASDVDRAIRFVKSKRAEWGIDHGTLVLGGGSAGGHLALLASTAPNVFVASNLPADLRAIDPHVDATIAFVGPSDLRPYVAGQITSEGINGPALVENLLSCSDRGTVDHATGLVYPRCTDSQVLRGSPLFWAAFDVFTGAKLPPVYLAYSEVDGLVPPSSQAEPLARMWQESAGFLATWLDLPPDAGHNISYGVNRTAFLRWMRTFAPPAPPN